MSHLSHLPIRSYADDWLLLNSTKNTSLKSKIYRSELELEEPISYSIPIHYIHLHAKTFGKVKNPPALPPAMG